jgi:hypothetical protein
MSEIVCDRLLAENRTQSFFAAVTDSLPQAKTLRRENAASVFVGSVAFNERAVVASILSHATMMDSDHLCFR